MPRLKHSVGVSADVFVLWSQTRSLVTAGMAIRNRNDRTGYRSVNFGFVDTTAGSPGTTIKNRVLFMFHNAKP